MNATFSINGIPHHVKPRQRRGIASLAINNVIVAASFHWEGDHEATLTIDGKSQRVFIAQDDHLLFIHLNGKTWEVEVKDTFSSAAQTGETSGRVTAPMPGVVVECGVVVGDSVAAGTPVMLIESMKLQTEIKAPVSGTVSAIDLSAGDSFEKGSVLIEIETEDGTDMPDGQ